MRILILAIALSAAGVLAGCEGEREHYYVFCDGRDANGWNLVGTEYDGEYLIACTYQSPDQQRSYTARCRDDGCD